MLNASLLLLKRNAREASADGGDLLQFRRMAYLLGYNEFFFCRERISPARAVLRSEIGIVTAAKSIDSVIGLADLGHRFGQPLPDIPAHILPPTFARFFQLAAQTIRLLFFSRGVGSGSRGFFLQPL